MKDLNFDSKPCEWVREQLDAYLSSELLVETTAAMLKHLEGCAACSAELESRLRLRDALRRAVNQQLPPANLGEAIDRQLRQDRPALFWSSGPRHWMLALAGLALVVVAGSAAKQALGLRRGRQLVAKILTLGVSDHVYCAIRTHNYLRAGRPADQLQARLGPEYAPLLPVAEQELPGFEILEAHICTVPGSPRKYVHFIALGHGTILSVILTRRQGEALPGEARLVAETVDGMRLYKSHLSGMDVAGFETNNYFGFVISDLGQNEVLHIAAALAPALRNQLDAG